MIKLIFTELSLKPLLDKRFIPILVPLALDYDLDCYLGPDEFCVAGHK